MLAVGVGLLPRLLPLLQAQTEVDGSAAQAKLLMHPERDPVVRELGMREEAMARFREAQAQFLKSRRVLTAALREPEVAKLASVAQQQDPVTWLSRRLRVETKGDFLKVSVEAHTRAEQVTLANAVAQAFLQKIVHQELISQRSQFDQLKNYYADLQNRTYEKKKQMASLREALGGVVSEKIDEQRRSQLFQQMGECATRRLEVRLQRAEAEVRLERIKENRDAAAAGELNQLEERIAVLTAQDDELKEETARIEGLLAESRAINRESAELDKLREEIAVSEKLTRAIGEEIERLSIELDGPPAVVLIEQAE
jgi:hypothetical protein